MRLSTLALLAFTMVAATTAIVGAQEATNSTTDHRNNWWEFGLADPVLDEVALFYLGQAYSGSADVADVLSTIYSTNNSDPWSWTMEWRKTAQRMERLAQESLDGGESNTNNEWNASLSARQAMILTSRSRFPLRASTLGHKLTAGQAYLRASTYYRASLHRHPDPFADEVATIAQQAVDAFDQFLTLSNYPCEPVRIPYEDNITLPGYLCITSSNGVKAPTILYNQGKDGW